MKLKDLKTKYNMIELIVRGKTFFTTVIELVSLEKAKKIYGDYVVESVKDFEDTKTTSVIVEREKLRT